MSTVEAEPLGRFLLQYVLCGTKSQLPCHTKTGLVTVEESASVLDRLHEAPLAAFSQSVEEGELFYVGPGLIVSVLGNEETGLSLWASSQTPEDLESLRDDRLTWR
ncbi:hypothetical protein [Streptomyces sp. NPDC048442]|uniref:hypothetical protein n=1 Tax=Streptomyces sp. NPDC048442 TaxID=3154823 RepID=UPI0034238104